MKNPDAQIITLLGDRFEEFEKLALMALEQPATMSYVEGQMTRLLNQMPDDVRIQLREALRATGHRR